MMSLCVGACTPRPRPQDSDRASAEPPPTAPDDRFGRGTFAGTLLLFGDSGPFVLDSDGDGPVELPKDVAGLELSPDGSQVLAARFVREPTGITRHVELVTVDVHSGETATLLKAASREDVAPASWSPDGARVAYRSTTYERDPSVVHPFGHRSRSALCIVSVDVGEPRCFRRLGRVDGFAWSPNGAWLAIDSVGPEPLRLLEVRTGRTRTIGRPHGPWLRRVGSHGRFIGFFHPSWSPSGRYVAAVADMEPRRIVVFDTRGGPVTGRGFSDVFTEPVWAPSRDVIAYASVTGRIRENHIGLDTDLRLLHARTGRERVVRAFRGYPLVYGLEWDPAGRAMAALLYDAGHEQLSLVDLEDRRWSRVRLRHSLSGLLDWAP